MSTYSKKIQFERNIVNFINENINMAELIGLSKNSIEIWWRELNIYKDKYYKLRIALENISKEYGFILEESNLTKKFPVDEKTVISVIEDLKNKITV